MPGDRGQADGQPPDNRHEKTEQGRRGGALGNLASSRVSVWARFRPRSIFIDGILTGQEGPRQGGAACPSARGATALTMPAQRCKRCPSMSERPSWLGLATLRIALWLTLCTNRLKRAFHSIPQGLLRRLEPRVFGRTSGKTMHVCRVFAMRWGWVRCVCAAAQSPVEHGE